MKFEFIHNIDIEVRFEKTLNKAYFSIINKKQKTTRCLKPFTITQAHTILNRLRDTKMKLMEEKFKRRE